MHDMKNTAPYARGNEASRLAAHGIEHRLTGIRSDVFDFIVSRETYGATNSEIAEGLSMMRDNTQPRTSELREAGYIESKGKMRLNGNGRNETVWVACQSVPAGEWQAVKKKAAPVKEQAEQAQSGLWVFDDVLRRNPHLRNTFRMSEISIIRADLAKAEGV